MSIFFEGDLQSAIALSLQSKKDFAAYICAAEDEEDDDVAAICASWEEDITSNDTIRNYFTISSVLMRIRQNSTEYGHLTAFVPDVKVPSVIILRQGQVQHRFDDAEALMKHCQLFDQALQYQRRAAEQAASQTAEPTPLQQNMVGSAPEAAIMPQSAPPVTSPSASTYQSTSQPSQPTPQQTSSASTSTAHPTPTTTVTQSTEEPPAPQTSRGHPSVQTSLTSETSNSRSSASRSWAAEQRERNLEARRERDRVLAQIEADKRARKAKEAERKNLSSLVDDASSTPISKETTSRNGTSCRIQIRLISGRTIRQTFEAQATPASDLRPLVDSELAKDTEGAKVPAYRLKRMGVPPEPTREIGLSEEQQSFTELGLLPSATLVVTPIHGAADAYSETGNGWGLLSFPVSVVGGAANMAIGAVGAVGGALSSTLGFGRGQQSDDNAPQDERPSASSNAGRVRTLHEVRDRNDREDQNFYNGNQLSFQSNESDDT